MKNNYKTPKFSNSIYNNETVFIENNCKAIFKLRISESNAILGEAIIDGIVSGWFPIGDISKEKIILIKDENGTALVFDRKIAKNILSKRDEYRNCRKKSLDKAVTEYKRKLHGFLKKEWQYISYDIILVKDGMTLAKRSDFDIPNYDINSILSGRNIILKNMVRDMQSGMFNNVVPFLD